VEVELITEPGVFLERARAVLERDEARHNLAYGVAGTALANPDVYPEFRAWIVHAASAGSDVVGAALRTPPHNLIVLGTPAGGAIEALAAAVDEKLPGVVGAIPEVDAFANAWSERRPVTPVVRFEQRIYLLREVEQLADAPGELRLATPADRDVVLERFRAFGEEVRHGADELRDDDELGRMIDARLASEVAGVALWVVAGSVCSLAGFGGPTPTGIRIGPVHTPLASRGRGYGTAVTARVSRLLLERGHRFCFLYTDLANPTSNAIYTRIGYEPVCDSREVSFVAVPVSD
jgi:hypothetical protein